jgi:putative addiction module killer protein
MMVRVIATDVFTAWFERLRDHGARQRISIRLDRLRSGNPGDWKSVGDGIAELRIAYGPGYRLYCVRRGETLVILLCGGDKSTQQRDIAQAKLVLGSIGGRYG